MMFITALQKYQVFKLGFTQLSHRSKDLVGAETRMAWKWDWLGGMQETPHLLELVI